MWDGWIEYPWQGSKQPLPQEGIRYGDRDGKSKDVNLTVEAVKGKAEDTALSVLTVLVTVYWFGGCWVKLLNRKNGDNLK